MPKIPRTCTVCGAVFVRSVTVTEEAKGWGRFCSKSCRFKVFQKTHGHWSDGKPSPTYTTWKSMHQRCLDPKHDGFSRYGEKGITICDQWLNNFEQFFADMGERPKGTTLDRIDGSLGYSKENCQWSSPKQQANNRKSNVNVMFHGELMPYAEAARRSGISRTLVYSRMTRGWPEAHWFDPPMKGKGIAHERDV